MKQQYFILVLAHSLHGRLRRIHIPHQVIYGVLALALIGGFSLFGFVSSYVRMAWKVSNYNSLKREADGLRRRYDNLQKVVKQTNDQLATLQLFANEVSVAYGIKQKLEGPAGISLEAKLAPTFTETVAEYNYLRSSNLSHLDRNFARRFHVNLQPSMWPVEGRLMSAYGQRTDPFSGEGAYHTGVDISAPTGTIARATADGVVIFADFLGGYGRAIVIDHGHGITTRYGHLANFAVTPGQQVNRGDTIGYVGLSGRSTGPHLHYEVRINDTPVNPHKYLRLTVAHTGGFAAGS